MLEHTIEIRVRYQETDGQRRLHHANFFTYFEQARVEFLRALGYSYRDLEDAGTLLVVAEISCKYFRGVDFDETLQITTRIVKSRAARIEHEYTVRRGEDLIAIGKSTIACIDREGHVTRLPDFLIADV